MSVDGILGRAAKRMLTDDPDLAPAVVAVLCDFAMKGSHQHAKLLVDLVEPAKTQTLRVGDLRESLKTQTDEELLELQESAYKAFNPNQSHVPSADVILEAEPVDIPVDTSGQE